MKRRQDLPALREWLRLFRARLAKHARPDLRDVVYEFLFLAPDEDEPMGITEGGFFGEDQTGHPKLGTYTVRVLAGPDEGAAVLEEREGEWTESGMPTFAEREQTGGDIAAVMRSITASTRDVVHQLHAELGRLRTLLGNAEERERKARESMQALVDANAELKQDLHAAQLERDEALYQQEQAQTREQAAQDELAAMRRRGGELAPVAVSAVKAFFDRGIEQLTGEPPVAAEREGIEEAQSEIGIALCRNLANTLALVHAGILSWDSVRVLIITAYGVDPGDTPPPAGWQPPPIPDEDEDAAEEAADAEGMH